MRFFAALLLLAFAISSRSEAVLSANGQWPTAPLGTKVPIETLQPIRGIYFIPGEDDGLHFTIENGRFVASLLQKHCQLDTHLLKSAYRHGNSITIETAGSVDQVVCPVVHGLLLHLDLSSNSGSFAIKATSNASGLLYIGRVVLNTH